jgi:hypothetical protein
MWFRLFVLLIVMIVLVHSGAGCGGKSKPTVTYNPIPEGGGPPMPAAIGGAGGTQSQPQAQPQAKPEGKPAAQVKKEVSD